MPGQNVQQGTKLFKLAVKIWLQTTDKCEKALYERYKCLKMDTSEKLNENFYQFLSFNASFSNLLLFKNNKNGLLKCDEVIDHGKFCVPLRTITGIAFDLIIG